ncbi:MAG: lasso RiPP family leader peptide-containing protein [Anaerolineales bacterium]|nr:lasso RiPP family leader peptide-containing protein [Anaerolineales bacterium]
MSNKENTFHDGQKIEDIPKSRKSYQKPHLQELGDLRTVTLGGSPGAGDSGVGDPRYPLGFHGDFLPPPEF